MHDITYIMSFYYWFHQAQIVYLTINARWVPTSNVSARVSIQNFENLFLSITLQCHI